MSAPFNAYTTLGVMPAASATEVKRAYLRLAATAHPDKVLWVRSKRHGYVLLTALTRRHSPQGGSSEAFALVQKAYATLTGACTHVPPGLPPLFPPPAGVECDAPHTPGATHSTDPRQKQSHDDALTKAGQGPPRGVHVHGQTSGHAVSQHGVAPGVTVTLHGQHGPPARQQQPADGAQVAGKQAWVDAAEDTAARAQELASQAAAGRAAAAGGQHEQAVASFTRALRACASGGDTQGTGETRHGLYAARSAAYAALGDHRRAQADADEAAELAS